MSANRPHVQIGNGVDIKAVVIVLNPKPTAFLYPNDPPEKNSGHFQQDYGIRDPKRLKVEIKQRHPKAKIYLLDLLGAGTPEPWD